MKRICIYLIYEKDCISDSYIGCMLWCMENRDRLDGIGKEARKTYERNFTMEIFGRNLKTLFQGSGSVLDGKRI